MFEKMKTEAFDSGFDAGQNEALSYVGPLLDNWDRLSNDEKGQVKSVAPTFVETLERLRATMDRA